VRRAIGWALVGLVILVSAGGAWLGIETGSGASPPSGPTFLAQVMAATRDAGTARFTYSSATTSSSPVRNSSTSGRGLVNFATDSVSTAESDRGTSFVRTNGAVSHVVPQTSLLDQIWIGRTAYNRLASLPGPLSAPWTSFTFPPDFFGSLGPLSTVGPIGTLDTEMSIPGLRVVDLGSSLVQGSRATRYLLVAATCVVPKALGEESTSPLEIWLDGQGRLVQARDSVRIRLTRQQIARFSPPIGSGSSIEWGLASQSVTVSTIRLFDFGAPVTISAPKTEPSGSGGGGSASGGGSAGTIELRGVQDCVP
jgi:hypothetical protein